MPIAHPDQTHPLVLPDGTPHKPMVFLNQVIDHPNIEVGDYTYLHDPTMPVDYAARIAPYLFPGAPEMLRIGKFCQIAEGVQFITATANHPMTGLSTYPFAIFDPDRFAGYRASVTGNADTEIGNDCWLGRDSMMLPGARLGDGVIVGARAVVTGQVPDYAIVVGNPGRVMRRRFSDDQIAALKRLTWWDWPIDEIEEALPLIEGGDIDGLVRFAGQRSD